VASDRKTGAWKLEKEQETKERGTSFEC